MEKRKNDIGIKEFLELATIARDCLKRISGENFNLIEELWLSRVKGRFPSLSAAKSFLFNIYARKRFHDRLERKYYSE